MTKEEVIARLAKEKRSVVARATKLPYMYLYRLERRIIENPGTNQMDTLRNYFISLDIERGRLQ